MWLQSCVVPVLRNAAWGNKVTSFYTAYNLVIASEIALPELHQAAPSDASADVHIRFGRAQKPLLEGRSFGLYLWAQANQLWFHIPEVGWYLITSGNEIVVEPERDASEDAIRLFLLGSAFGALLLQRRYLVLHGNAVRIGRHCMVSIGESGAGKSTLAAGFMRRGYAVLADDVVPVDDEQRAIPGFPRLKLWGDAANRISIDTSDLRRIRSEDDKYNVPLGESFCGDAHSIRWIYVLNRGKCEHFSLEPLAGTAIFAPLFSNVYRPEFVVAMGLEAQHMRACGKLVSKARVAQITRPDRGFALDQLIDTLLEDMERNP